MTSADIAFWALASLATFLVGASKGGVPGVGILAVPVLSQVISPVVAAGLLLPLYVLSDWYGLWLYRKHYDLWNIKIMVLTSLIGLGIGWATASYNNDELVKFMVGVIGIWYTIDLILKSRRQAIEPKPADIPRGIFWGTIVGFTSSWRTRAARPSRCTCLPQRLEKMVYMPAPPRSPSPSSTC